MKSLHTPLCLSVYCALILTACGGESGGSTTPTSTSHAGASSSSAAITSINQVNVSQSMSWSLRQTKTLHFSVVYANNAPAPGVQIKLFTYSTEDPHAKSAPIVANEAPREPVPISLVLNLMTDSNGYAQGEILVNSEQKALLAVINDGSQHQSTLIATTREDTIPLRL